MVNQPENSKHWFSLIMNSIDRAIITTNEKGLVTYMNPSAEKLTGWNQSDAYGKNLSLVFNVGDKENIQLLVSPEVSMLKGPNAICKKNTILLFPEKGKELNVNYSITNLIGNSGETIGFTVVFHDVTNERKLIDQLRCAEKTDVISELVSGIAHDFNNALTVINGNSEVLLSKLQKTDKLRYMVEEIYEAGNHAANITNQLMALSYQQKTKIRVFDLNTILNKLENLIYSIIGEDINIEILTSNDPLMIESDPVQIEQSIINLLVNAKDAMPLGGKISVRTANVELDIEFSKINAEIKPGRYAKLSISDTGIGISPLLKEKIFDPYFKTKEIGKSAGLGLSKVKNIVNQSRGYIFVDSKEGEGSTFVIYLPFVEKSPDIPKTGNILDNSDKTSREQVKLGFQETNAAKKWIMVVSGNDNVRELITVELQRLNHTVLAMPNGKESFKEYESLKDIVDIVFVEWILPDMAGCDCVEKILQINPCVSIVYLCDYIPVNEERIPPAASILLNPVISNDLKKIISEHK